jgi:hypothetical protein
MKLYIAFPKNLGKMDDKYPRPNNHPPSSFMVFTTASLFSEIIPLWISNTEFLFAMSGRVDKSEYLMAS